MCVCWCVWACEPQITLIGRQQEHEGRRVHCKSSTWLKQQTDTVRPELSDWLSSTQSNQNGGLRGAKITSPNSFFSIVQLLVRSLQQKKHLCQIIKWFLHHLSAHLISSPLNAEAQEFIDTFASFVCETGSVCAPHFPNFQSLVPHKSVTASQ